MSEINHPLALKTVVIASKPPCACRPHDPWVDTKGIIMKVINNHSGIWYFLSAGATVKSDWIKEVVK